MIYFLPTNLTNFRASECKTELVRVMPSAAENVKEIYTNSLLSVKKATCSVARISRITLNTAVNL